MDISRKLLTILSAGAVGLAVWLPHAAFAQGGNINPSSNPKAAAAAFYVVEGNTLKAFDDSGLSNEPRIIKMKYLQDKAPPGIQERISALLFGIQTDLPPEYDYYGYEIRYYMKSVGGPDVFKTKERLLEEMNNIEKAKVVAEFWKKDMESKADGIEKDFDDGTEDPSLSGTFKFNRGKVNAFFVDLNNWLKRNEDLLVFAYHNFDNYTVEEPYLRFSKYEIINQCADLFKERYIALAKMKEYGPFNPMVY